MKVGLIGIDEYVDETQGIHYERYNLHGLYENSLHVWLKSTKINPLKEPSLRHRF